MNPSPRIAALLFTSILILCGAPRAWGAAPVPLPRALPEAQGVSSSRLIEFVEALDQFDTMHGVMILRHGAVIAEGYWTPYRPESRHELYSLSKSFTSTAVGLAVAEGKLSVDDEVLKFFPGQSPSNPSANLKAMRVRDLLTMSTGHQDEPPSSPDKISARSFLTHPVPHLPGTHFKYNTPATFMLSALVQKVTGQTVLDYLQPRLFEPLGIDSPKWDTNFEGISLGGYGLELRTEDIAKFGQLYLKKGQWQGRQILPSTWVEEATSKQTSNGSNPKSDWAQGYGYQFWRCRHGAYRGDGAFGQYCVVLPAQDAVLAITSGVKDMQAVLNAVWDKLIPAMESRRLPKAPQAQQALRAKLARLSVAHPQGNEIHSDSTKYFGRPYRFESNDQQVESIELTKSEGGGLGLVIKANGVTSRIECGFREWRMGRAHFGLTLLRRPYVDAPVAGSVAWVSPDEVRIRICATETPFYKTLALRFDGDRVLLDAETNVGFGPLKKPRLAGTVTR